LGGPARIQRERAGTDAAPKERILLVPIARLVPRPVLLAGLAAVAFTAGVQAQTGPPASPARAADDERLVREALKHRGTRYRWGGASRGGFDCSGFTRYIFRTQRGIELPHSASAQARLGVRVTNPHLRDGDLLFFQTYRRGISHVGIYLGDGKFVHAANRRSGVRTDTLTGYWARRLKLARRIP